MAVRHTKSGKAARPDKILAEVLKADVAKGDLSNCDNYRKRLQQGIVKQDGGLRTDVVYDVLKCKIMNGGQLTDFFEVNTGVKQDCLLSPFLFLLMIDWITKTSTSEGKRGIQCTSRMQLDDLDFADDLALLSRTKLMMNRI
ncbi:unnamed protein product [Schistosoma curassoni]|uniref:Reverse transcriptase domain-containing protein n=1 Tax=Schistosoma curassoni TaxID=6186 RepID=A0A183JVR5_9TREM|nr:unnamed protein product [Schistosoma curassoni]